MRVLIVGSPYIASYKIGIEQPFRELQRHGVCHYKVRQDFEADKGDVAAADVILFFRTVHPGAYNLLREAKNMGKKTVYVIDDYFLAMSPGSESGQFYHDPMRREVYTRFIREADMVKVASDYFARHLEQHYRPRRVVSFTGSVDFQMLDRLERPEKRDGRIYIGYEGGRKESAFEPVIQALRGVARTYGNRVKIEFFGYIPDGLEDMHQVTFAQYDPDYRNFLRRLYQSNWDIGLAPLDETLLHHCKTNNKYREYAACDIAGIYADTPPYQGWVKHGVNGLLVRAQSKAWYEAICELIEHPRLRQQIREHAHVHAREHFTIAACAKRWREEILQDQK